MNALINVNNFRVGVACVVSPDAIGSKVGPRYVYCCFMAFYVIFTMCEGTLSCFSCFDPMLKLIMLTL